MKNQFSKIIKGLRIGNQLLVAFASMIVFLVVLGLEANSHSEKIHQMAEMMYNHPVNVRNSVATIKINVLSKRILMKNLLDAKTLDEKMTFINAMEKYSDEINRNFDIIRQQYLGPKLDVERAYDAYFDWENTYDLNSKLFFDGKVTEAKENIRHTGDVAQKRERLLTRLAVIERFATAKLEYAYAESNDLYQKLQQKLLFLLIFIVLSSTAILLMLKSNIQKPINELIDVADRFDKGDMTVRSNMNYSNEFGKLALTFNALADNIQQKSIIEQRFTDIAQTMLREEDGRKFFKLALSSLCTHTNSQMAAVYILSDDQAFFEHFESIGVSEEAKAAFKINSLEGEFGIAIHSKKIEYIKNIPHDTRFVLQTVSGKFIPREIVTIPILVAGRVVAVISLASVRKYSQETVILIERIYETLCARVEGVLAYRKLRNLLEKMAEQNIELEAQKNALHTQSVELSEQNIELEQQKHQLNEANILKTSFLSNMSHELRTPLNSIIALSGVLGRKLKDIISNDEKSYLDVIERNGKQLLALIDDILNISRIELGKEELECADFDVNAQISEIVEMIMPQAAPKGLNIIHNHANHQLLVYSDQRKLKHILQNLIGNAVKFTASGKVEIEAQVVNDKVEILVSDTGIGISDENQLVIFDEFRQGDSSTSRKFGGTGLGLSIAKKYAELLGGTVQIEHSQLNRGSVFKVTILTHLSHHAAPLTSPIVVQNDFGKLRADSPSPAESNDSTSHVVSSTNISSVEKPLVLMIKKKSPNRSQIQSLLISDYEVLVAENTDEVMGLLQTNTPHLVLMDFNLPGLEGVELLRKMRKNEKLSQLKIVALVNTRNQQNELAYIQSSFDGYIQLPIDETLFFETINRVLYGK